jgi:hypothetical protein
MIGDLDDLLEPFLKWTLVLWLTPYILWFFTRLVFQTAWNWVTEPEPAPR